MKICGREIPEIDHTNLPVINEELLIAHLIKWHGFELAAPYTLIYAHGIKHPYDTIIVYLGDIIIITHDGEYVKHSFDLIQRWNTPESWEQIYQITLNKF